MTSTEFLRKEAQVSRITFIDVGQKYALFIPLNLFFFKFNRAVNAFILVFVFVVPLGLLSEITAAQLCPCD